MKGYKTMNKKDFKKSVNFVSSIISKNSLYTDDNLKEAIQKASDIINNINIYNPFGKGNNKLAKNILIFDLPSKITCKYACKYCYAKKAENYRPVVRIKRLYNLIVIHYALYNKSFYRKLVDHFINIIQKHCKNCNKKQIKPILRVHSSGDIYSNKYLQLWLYIANLCKSTCNISMYTYTKMLTSTEINYINNKHTNFNIVKSLITVNNITYINYGTMEYLNKLIDIFKQNNIRYFICDYGITNKLHCGINCTACMSKDYDVVLFKQH